MTLYDAYGREVDTGMLREEQAALRPWPECEIYIP